MENTSATALQSLSRDLADAVKQVGAAVVAINARRHLSSSGVYWRDGIIVTAAHTLRRTEDISVILAGGQTVAAALAGADPSTDLAVIKVDAAGLTPPRFGDSSQLEVGHVVLAAGRGAERGLNATLGIIGVLSGAWRTWRGGLIDRFIGLDLELHPGAAGGPLTDAHGRVLGINTSGLSRHMALTVPASTVDRVVGRLLETGYIRRGYLGLGMRPIPLPQDLKSALGLSSDSGLLVVSVEPNGPGGSAGLLFGDVIAALEGKAIGDMQDLQGLLGPESVGSTMPLSVVRGGNLVEVNVTVGERTPR
ncbi:MAG TPA: trypsin-like peptidase domain-containing protein [Candidatus Binatia bacterium]